jgi:hypothetical protein
MGLSYHVFVVFGGRRGLTRLYVEDSGQSREDAEKVIHLTDSEKVIGYKFARPTSFHRAAIAEREARQPGDAPADGTKRRFVYRSKS